ncbi:PASTA domain-containing protein [Actinotalea sp. M2MS4P-6]|uniref:PASTA domain-containing protein n=1 Tax=Actinotalea sp. M2MS4P-6 TaxID=2983762 RepID=UPI0021E3B601|nr:PASTA domain-containing protein [Actinotalea sp. M2MS4P-6]MCV2395347.1 PASTA domain-containing protein [Actinotalea sp. M2MS4P-6]
MNDDAQDRAEAFVRRVETAMVGVGSATRAELTDGLADHLLERGDDGHRLIDEDLDPDAYAAELLGASAPTVDHASHRRSRTLVGAVVLAVLVAIGAWAGFTRWESPQAAPEPTASTGAAQVYVPNVRGLSSADAVARLEATGLTAELQTLDDGASLPGTSSLPRDVVADQDPANGTPVDRGSTVILLLTP